MNHRVSNFWDNYMMDGVWGRIFGEECIHAEWKGDGMGHLRSTIIITGLFFAYNHNWKRERRNYGHDFIVIHDCIADHWVLLFTSLIYLDWYALGRNANINLSVTFLQVLCSIWFRDYHFIPDDPVVWLCKHGCYDSWTRGVTAPLWISSSLNYQRVSPSICFDFLLGPSQRHNL